jgi:hypothetical protein
MDRELIAPHRQISDSVSLYVCLKDGDREGYRDSPPHGVPRRANGRKHDERVGDSVALAAQRRQGDIVAAPRVPIPRDLLEGLHQEGLVGAPPGKHGIP